LSVPRIRGPSSVSCCSRAGLVHLVNSNPGRHYPEELKQLQYDWVAVEVEEDGPVSPVVAAQFAKGGWAVSLGFLLSSNISNIYFASGRLSGCFVRFP
jgi:hypothetical protein